MPTGNGRVFGALCTQVLATSAAHSMLLPLVPLFASRLDVSPALVGVIVSTMWLLPVVLAPGAGILVDRCGVRRLQAAGVVGMSMAPLIVAWHPTLAGLVAMQLLVGVFHLLTVLASQAAVGLMAVGRHRQSLFGWYASFLAAGQLIGPLLAGSLIGSVGFQAAFGLAGAIALLGLPGAIAGAPRTPVTRAAAGSPELKREEAGRILANPALRVAIFSSTGMQLLAGAYASFFPVYLDTLGFEPTTIGYLLAIRGFASISVRPFINQVEALFGTRLRTLVTTSAVVALAFSVIGGTGSVGVLALLSLVIGMGGGVSQPISMTIVADHIRPQLQGTALGIRLAANRVAQFCAPLVMGVAINVTGYGIGFATGGVLFAAFIVPMLGLRKNFELAESRLES